MKYLSASEVAKEWGVSSTQIRKYCREGRIPGAFTENNAWYVPETAVKPMRKETAEQEKEVLFPIAKVLRRQMKKKNFHGLYDYVQINFAYSSGRLASVRLTRQCTSDVYFKSKVKVGFEPLKVSDLIETLNHFDTMEYILKSINKPLSEKFIKEIHWRLTQGTVDERNSGHAQDEIEAGLKKACELGCEIAISTVGAKGSVVYDGHNFYNKAPYSPESEIVDTIGAGDSFLTGFSTTYIDGCKRLRELMKDDLDFLMSYKDKYQYRKSLIEQSIHVGNAMAMKTCMTYGSFGGGVPIDA